MLNREGFFMGTVCKYALSGAAAGAANGLFGAGGGMILVPLLTHWCRLPDKTAFATSISVIAPICLVSIIIYWFRGCMDFHAALPYLIGGFLGGLLGGNLFQKVPAKFLHKALGLIIVYGGIRSILS